MKTAYELAMERLGKSAPTVTLTADQKKRLAELNSEYQAKIADKEIFLQGKISQAMQNGDLEAKESLERQLASDRKNLLAELERKKEVIRQENSRAAK